MIQHNSLRRNIWSALAFGLLLCFVLDPVWAQRGGRGRGGFDRNSPFRLISDDDIQNELKLTGEQIERIEKLEEELREAQAQEPSPAFPENDEDRAAFFAKMRERLEQRNAEAMEKIKGVLQENQYQRLSQIRLQRVGLSALGTEEIAAELKFSDKQTEDLSELLQEYQAARFNFRMPRDERDKTTEELTGKIMAVLSDEQKAAWEAKLGPPFEEGDGDRRDRGPRTTTADNDNPAPVPRPTYTPPENEGPVVVSFDGTKEDENAAAAKPAGPAPPSKERSIRFHLENAPWEMVLREFARKADLTLQILDLPPGSLSYTNDEKWYTPVEALDILHGYLLQMGFIMVQRDRFLVVIDLDSIGGGENIPPNLIPNIPLSELERNDRYGKHTLVSVVLPLDGAEANDAAREVEGLLGPQGSVVPLSVSNSLVVTDTITNVRRVHDLLKGVTNTDPEALHFQSFALDHISADEAAIMVREQLGLATTASSSSDSRSRFPWGNWGRDSRSSSRDSRSNTTRATSTASQAKVTPDPRNNAVLVTATKNELAIAEQILKAVDTEHDRSRDTKPYLYVYHLKKADVDEVRRTLEAILPPGLVVGEDEDRDGGRLHVRATAIQHEQVASLIGKMDGTSAQAVAVIPLSKRDPLAVANTLTNMFALDGESAPMIMADSGGRQLLVRGSTEQLDQIKMMLAGLGEDGSGNAETGDRGPLRTYPLGGRDPEEFTRLLEQWWSANSSTPIRVVIPSNSPIRRRAIPSLEGGEFPASQNRPRFDETDPKSTAIPRKPLFAVSVEDKADEKAPAQAETPREDAQEPFRIPKAATLRVSKSGEATLDGQPIENTTQLSIQLTQWKSETSAGERKFELRIHPETPAGRFAPILGVLEKQGIPYHMMMSAEEAPDSPSEQTEPQKSSPKTSAAPSGNAEQPSVATSTGKIPIVLTVRGGDLHLLDPTGRSDRLNEVETMIEQLAMAIPPRTTWTVYYLRSADAAETAIMLEQLFPASSVSSSVYNDGSIFGGLTSGLASLGGGLASATGLDSLAGGSTTLRIIPEFRSNSLFVSGPADQVQAVEEMLRVLDADELPETLRDRVPRMIPVEYANVSEVAEIVKNVFHDYLEDNEQRQSRTNPLAALMGGSSRSTRGGRSNGNGSSSVKMTIGVDTQTSKLIVSASDALFQQVKETVEELDKAAYEARRTVQVVPVSEANSVVIQQALQTLLPSVSVSTTSSTSSSSRSGDSRSRGSSSDDAERRARIEEYWRSRTSGDSSRSTRSWGSRGGDSSRSWGSSSRGGDSGRSWGSSRGDSGRSWGSSSRGGDSGRSWGRSSRGR